jgi:hypothetical protein
MCTYACVHVRSCPGLVPCAFVAFKKRMHESLEPHEARLAILFGNLNGECKMGVCNMWRLLKCEVEGGRWSLTSVYCRSWHVSRDHLRIFQFSARVLESQFILAGLRKNPRKIREDYPGILVGGASTYSACSSLSRISSKALCFTQCNPELRSFHGLIVSASHPSDRHDETMERTRWIPEFLVISASYLREKASPQI